MLWTDALSDVRSLLQDRIGAVKRYSDDDIRSGFNAGIRLAYRKRPDLFLDGVVPEIAVNDIVEPNASTYVLPVINSYADGFVHYAAAWCLMRDDEYTADGRAGTMMAIFWRDLTGRAPA